MPYTTIDKGSKYFNAVTYTGTGSSLSITGVGFKPDWVWIKNRSGVSIANGLYDAVRGVQKELVSNSTAAETTETTGLTAFGTDGFTVGALAKLNTSSATHVSWNWLGANTTVSNTSGSITSTVSANTTAGFSIVSYTGTGANATVGHGLGVSPRMIIFKNRTTSARNWIAYHASLGATLFLEPNTTAAQNTDATQFNNTAPTSTVFSVGSSTNTNQNTNAQIAYCFADVKGYSKFGSYTGNGSTDGTFVYTGFKPKYLMTKPSSTTGAWTVYDTSRDTFNVADKRIEINTSDGEYNNGNGLIDFLSNGFKCRVNHASNNTSGVTYIYMAFAENPFVSSKGLPCTAR